MAECRSCGANIRWAVTAGGKRIPLDREPAPAGNLRVLEWRGEVPLVEHVAEGSEVEGARYVSHFATCPGAATWRKPKPAATDAPMMDPSAATSAEAQPPDLEVLREIARAGLGAMEGKAHVLGYRQPRAVARYVAGLLVDGLRARGEVVAGDEPAQEQEGKP